MGAVQTGNRVPHWEAHQRVRAMYTWHNVAKRTEKVRVHKQAAMIQLFRLNSVIRFTMKLPLEGIEDS